MMITKSEFAFITALAAVVVASPSTAQSLRDTSNVAMFKYPTISVRKSGHRLYDLPHRYDTRPFYNMSAPAPFAFDPNSPQATGGGSLGYNQNLYNY
jgi:hypothetical protein